MADLKGSHVADLKESEMDVCLYWISVVVAYAAIYALYAYVAGI